MSPLAEKYKEKTKLYLFKCECGYEFPTRMKIPRCFECGKYTEK